MAASAGGIGGSQHLGNAGRDMLYESMNLASIWRLPLLFVAENNGIAQTTPTSETIKSKLQGERNTYLSEV